MRLILASQSPYRVQLLARLDIPFEQAPAAIDESRLADESPALTAIRLAATKARAVAARFPEALVLGSDQTASFAGRPLRKPKDFADAKRQLQDLRAQRVIFWSAVCLFNARSGRLLQDIETAEVEFSDFSDRQLDAYLLRENPLDCLAGLKSETSGISLLRAVIANDPNTLVGLPLIRLKEMLASFGLQPFSTVTVNDGHAKTP